MLGTSWKAPRFGRFVARPCAIRRSTTLSVQSQGCENLTCGEALYNTISLSMLHQEGTHRHRHLSLRLRQTLRQW
jgi:hypothetical protein